MEEKVKTIEVAYIQKLLNDFAPEYDPKLLYCLVNRNVQHRLFAEAGTAGTYLNPGSGFVIDQGLVEMAGDKIFDFYLIPHKATVATAQPVLYKVIQNTTSLSKDDIETTTYHLCHNYFNFAGPIKVPMVCMYAHKIALYSLDNKIVPNANLSKLIHFV